MLTAPSSLIERVTNGAMEHFCPCSINTSHPLSPLSNQAVTIARWFYSLVPGNLAWFTGLYHTGNCSTVSTLCSKRGQEVRWPGWEIASLCLDRSMWTSPLTQTKRAPSYQFVENYVFAEVKVDLERETGSLGADGMFLYPVGFPSTFTWMEARKALKEKRQRLAGLIQKCLGIILMVSYKRTGLN